MPTATETWAQKRERAQALAGQIKEEFKAGVKNAEQTQQMTAKMQDVQKLMTEVRAEKAEDERKQLETIMEEFERQSASGSAGDSAFAERQQTRQLATSAAAADPLRDAFSVKPRLVVASDKAAAISERLPVLKAALTEGTPGTGGFLVVPQYFQQLFAEVRRQGNALRALGWLNMHPVESNLIMIPRGAGSATFGIVAEGTAKPSADPSFTQIQVNIFTAAGIYKMSKQMAQDSSPTAMDLAVRELGSLAGNYEEQKCLYGSGTGEPRGILNVTGLSSPAPLAAGLNQQAVIDKMLDAVVNITTSYFGPPTGALMHPRRLAWLLKAKDTAGNYLFNPSGSFRQPNAAPMMDDVTSVSTGVSDAPYSLFGIPIGESANVPTNLGVGTNEDTVILAAWQEAHWFQRQEVTVDVSDIAGTAFEQNLVFIRLEERFGFTAERYPSAFAAVTGPSLSQS